MTECDQKGCHKAASRMLKSPSGITYQHCDGCAELRLSKYDELMEVQKDE